jgi:hypothetical protein
MSVKMGKYVREAVPLWLRLAVEPTEEIMSRANEPFYARGLSPPSLA